MPTFCISQLFPVSCDYVLKNIVNIKMLLWKKQPSRDQVEMFAFEIFHDEDQILPLKWHLDAVTQSWMKKMFMSMKSLKEINCPGVFFK